MTINNLQFYSFIFVFEIHKPLFQQGPDPGIPVFLAWILTLAVVTVCSYYVLRYLETIYVKLYKKPFFVHFYIFPKRLPQHLRSFLEFNDFYKKLDSRKKRYFEHRIAVFLSEIRFVGRQDLVVDDQKKMQVAMMVIQLTFGMRHYLLDYLNTIIIYPSTYFSVLNQTENNGEFNPRSKALVLSWEHFEAGNLQQNDGINLGIHEITHAIHYSALKSNNISSEIFYDTFLELEQYLSSVEIRNKIRETQILRDYAFTDKFEFIAVLVEVFMESPKKLKQQFPSIYSYVKRMLNFKYYD